MDSVVPKEAKAEAGKRSNWFLIGLDLLAILFSLYAFVKLFVFDLDVYVVSLISPEFAWLLNYKILIVLGVVLVAMAVTKSLTLGLAAAYVAFYPFVILLWKIPRFVWKQQ